MKVLLISGSPRDGNSESVLRKLQNNINSLQNSQGTKDTQCELLLLRNQNIQKCEGCVEFCNKELK